MGGKKSLKVYLHPSKLHLLPSVAAVCCSNTSLVCRVAHFFFGATTLFVKSALFIQMRKVNAKVEFGEWIFKSHKYAIFVSNVFVEVVFVPERPELLEQF